MKHLTKIKKGEEGLKELQNFFKDADYRSPDYNFKYLSMRRIIDTFFVAQNFEKKYDMYGYNENHDFAESTFSILKRDDLFVHKNKHTIKRANGEVKTTFEYTVISQGKDGRYNIMAVEPKNVDGKMTLLVTTNLGMASEKSQEIDITKDIPKDQVSTFAKAFVAINAVEDAENNYKTAEDKIEEESEMQ